MHDKETVVLLHGIGHCFLNMHGIARFLRREGFEVINVTYPSIFRNLTGIADFLNAHFLKKHVWDRPRVHFVTHSMGGLALSHFLGTYKNDIPHDRLGRTVMIAPPHGGSEVADLMAGFLPYKWLFGPAGQELTTTHRAAVKPDVYYPLGIIAGASRAPYFMADLVIKEPHDGRVSVSSTRLDGMADHITLKLNHETISWSRRTNAQIIHFIRNGSFSHA